MTELQYLEEMAFQLQALDGILNGINSQGYTFSTLAIAVRDWGGLVCGLLMANIHAVSWKG